MPKAKTRGSDETRTKPKKPTTRRHRFIVEFDMPTDMSRRNVRGLLTDYVRDMEFYSEQVGDWTNVKKVSVKPLAPVDPSKDDR